MKKGKVRRVIKTYSIEQQEQWDSIVRSFSEHDIYWLNGYVKAFMIHGDGTPLLITYENGGTRGISVVMKRDAAKHPDLAGKIPEGEYTDISTPYGYGGWLIEGEETEKLFHAYEEWLRENGIISEFVRFHPMIRNHEPCAGFYEVARLGEVVHIDLTSEEEIWSGFTAKNRNVIRKAEKNGVRIVAGRTADMYEQFRIIYNETMDGDSAEPYYYFEKPFYDSLREDLSENAQIFQAEKDGKVIAASILLHCNGRMNYHLSGSLREYRPLAPTNLLLYEAARWGCENGCRTLYLGGGVGSGEDSLFRFKRAFSRGELNHFFIGKKICDPEKYDMLTALRSGIRNEGYFPKYRG